MADLTLAGGVPVIVGLAEVIKELGVPPRFVPIVDILLGIGWSLVLLGFSPVNVLEGVVIGLASAGLYRSTKVLINNA